MALINQHKSISLYFCHHLITSQMLSIQLSCFFPPTKRAFSSSHFTSRANKINNPDANLQDIKTQRFVRKNDYGTKGNGFLRLLEFNKVEINHE